MIAMENHNWTQPAAILSPQPIFMSPQAPFMASKAYKEHGVIVLWWDETECGDTAAFTLPFIIISKDAHENVNGLPFAGAAEYSHSSTLRTFRPGSVK